MAQSSSPAPAERADLTRLVEQGVATRRTYVPALDVFRESRRWHTWALAALLALGAGHILSGIIFFFAFNWQDLSETAKFLIVQGGMVACVAGWFVCRLDKGAGPAFGIGATVLIGVLLAIFGQVFQTPSTLYAPFTLWAVLSLAFAAMSKSVAHWTVWAAIFCVAVTSFIGEGIRPIHGIVAAQWAMLLASLCVAGLAYIYDRVENRYEWAKSQWFYPLLLVITLGGLFTVFTEAFWDDDFRPIWIASMISAAGMLAYHYKRKPTLLPLCLITFGVFAMAAQLGFRLLVDIRDFTLTSLLIFIWMTGLTIVLARIFKHYYTKFPPPTNIDTPHDDATRVEGERESISALAEALDRPEAEVSRALEKKSEAATAWYIDAMLAVGGVLAALFATLFFGSLLGMTLDISHEVPFIVIGLMIYGVSLWARLKHDNEFTRHFLNTLILAGGLLAVAALGAISVGGIVFIISGTIVSALTLWIVRDRILEFLVATGLVACAAYTLVKYEVPLPYIWLCLICAVGAVAGLTMPFGRRIYNAAGSASLLALPLIGGSLAIVAEFTDTFAMPGTAQQIATIPIMLGAVWWMNRSLLGSVLTVGTLRPSIVILIPLVIAAAMLPLGSVFAMLTLLIGYILGSRTLAFLGALMQIYFLTMFYYDLQITLLNKSIILMISGLVFVAIWAFLHRRRAEHV